MIVVAYYVRKGAGSVQRVATLDTTNATGPEWIRRSAAALAFGAGGHWWRLYVYPDGSDIGTAFRDARQLAGGEYASERDRYPAAVPIGGPA